MIKVRVKYGSKEYANGLQVVEYKVSTKEDAEALVCAIDDAQGYLNYEVTSIRNHKS